MRDYALTLFILAGLVTTLRFPFVGMLMWVWIAIMSPHQETYSFAQSAPWNLIIAIVTIGSWLFSSERKLPPDRMTTAAVLILLCWTTLNTFFAFDPAWSWHYWDIAWKMIAMCVLTAILTVNRVRIHALIWIVALSLAYYGVKGGIFVFLTGGYNHVFGPPNSMLADNNELGLALVMTLPLLNYLRLNSASRFIRAGLIVAGILTLTSIFCTYSRETYIALGALALVSWLRTKGKIRYLAAAVVVLVPLLLFMPQSFYDRASSIQQYNTDESFLTRLDSWWVAYRYAMDHVPFGAGFYGLNLQGVWDQYLPGEMHAAHSIYFQTLGEQGIVGLALYLVVIVLGFLNLRTVIRNARANNGVAWTRDLAIALQLSLLAFCIGGAAAPMAFFDLPFLWVMLSSTLVYLSRQERPVRSPEIPEILDSSPLEYHPQPG
jgi:probable O-glycosylation ligase (exosortase A-associated)